MSSSDAFAKTGSRLAGGLAALLLLAGCQAGPLYADAGYTTFRIGGAPTAGLSALRGRVAVSEAPDRTTQTVRNPLLFKLNAGERVVDPLYRVELAVSGSDRRTSIARVQTGPRLRASTYRMRATYRLVRVSDSAVLAQETKTTIVPYDETSQLYQEQRALIDARDQAGEQVATELELSIARALADERGL